MHPLLVVTGGTKGIGRAILEKFAQNGWDLVTCSRDKEDLEKLQREFSPKYTGINIHTFRADLSEKEEVLSFARKVSRLSDGKIDVLVNNTGVFIPGQVHNEPEGLLEKLIQTNLYSAYYLTRALLPAMIEQKKGHVFNVCSTASITPYINGGSYCVSKFALYGMTKALREEMIPYGIKVTALLPGATKTASWDGIDLPDERFMKASDLAEMVWSAYSLSPSAVVEEILMRPLEGDIE